MPRALLLRLGIGVASMAALAGIIIFPSTSAAGGYPNDAGYQAMADSINLALFRS